MPVLDESTAIRADRRLLLPGPHPPLTHLGATLLRYSVHAALRYALYQIGEPLPESPPTQLVALRLYLDGPALRRVLASPTSTETLGALLDPGGVAARPLPRRLRGVLWFHRRRLLLGASPIGRLMPRLSAFRRSKSEPNLPGARLSRLLPALGDALLGELVTALDRRQARAAGRTRTPVASPEAARFLSSSPTDLSRLGLPDPIAPSWREAIPAPAEGPPVEALAGYPTDGLRGGFREQYRHLLDLLRPSLLALAARAVDKGYLASSEDLFFVPFDLIDDLDGPVRPVWLDAAITSNRAEWQELRQRKAPADTFGNVELPPRLDLPSPLAPLWPLV